MKTLNSSGRKIISALMGLSLIASSLVVSAPANAAGDNAIMSTPSSNVANGATFTVTVNASISHSVRGYQFDVNFDPAALSIVSVNPAPGSTPGAGTWLGDFAAAHSGMSVMIANAYTIDNTLGHMTGLAYALQGGGAATVTGNGVLATITFQAKPSVNAVTTITLSNISFDDFLGTGSPLNMTVGNVPQPDLTVSNVAVTPTANASIYNVSFRVNNIGSLAAGASNASIVVDGGAPIIIAVPGIANGTFTTVSTASPITITGTSDTIVVTADSGNVIVESNEGNNIATTSYSYVPPAGQTTDVIGSVNQTLTFTQPGAANFGTLVLGQNTIPTSMNVLSNGAWTVTAAGLSPTTSGGVDGKMTKYNTGTSAYIPGVKLHNALNVQAGPGAMDGTAGVSGGNVNLTGVAQTLATGIAEAQNPDGISGELRGVSFNQQLQGNDAALGTGYVYKITVSFVASSTY